MGSKYYKLVREHLREFGKENPSYGEVRNPYPEGTEPHARFEAEIWGFRDGYRKALEWVLSQMR